MPRSHRNRRVCRVSAVFALIAVVALIVLISAYLLVQQLNASTVGDKRNQNAKVLNQAKQALIGYVAQQASPVRRKQSRQASLPRGGQQHRHFQ